MTLVTADNPDATRLTSVRPSWLERLYPRNSVGAATGWLIAAVSLGLALAASAWVSTVASDTLLALKYKQLNQYAERLSSQLDITLYGYLQSVRATAAILGAIPAQAHPTLRQYLDELQRTLPQFAWAGYVDASGRVIAATGGILEGENVADRPWFPQGLKSPFVMDLRKGPMQQDPLPASGPSIARYIALAAPIVDASGAKVGVVGVQMSWNWAEGLKRRLDLASHPRDAIETFVVDRDGTVLLGPADTVGHAWPRAQDRERYVDGSYSAQGTSTLVGPGWTVWVRERKDHALLGVARLRFEIFTILFGLGLVAAMVGAWGAHRVLRRIGLLAELADNVRNRDGPRVFLEGKDEAARIGGTLTALVAELQKDKAQLQRLNTQLQGVNAELQQLNAELDARVAARTREVERLSEENQYAAVIRERLRIARELHDTLAHSMMGMLTQMRLMRKFVDTNPQVLKDELARAEEAAQSGLNEARAAIAKMRYNPVRDAGLDAAVCALAQRFEQRTGIATAYSSEPRAANLGDSRAETVFRMIEELLHNIERHAAASEAAIALCYRDADATLTVTVRDDGIGFDQTMQTPGHYGLRGLREQATLIGATLTIDTAPQQGVCAIITLSLSPQR